MEKSFWPEKFGHNLARNVKRLKYPYFKFYIYFLNTFPSEQINFFLIPKLLELLNINYLAAKKIKIVFFLCV